MATKKPMTPEEKLLKAIFGRTSSPPRETKTSRCMVKVEALAEVDAKLDMVQRHIRKGRVGEARGLLIHVATWNAPTPEIKSSVKSALKMVSAKKGISRYKMEAAVWEARKDVQKEVDGVYKKCR